MSSRSFVVIERRAVPRIRTSFAAELALGTVLVPVTVRDVSSRGCGVIVAREETGLPDRVGGRGLVRLPGPGADAPGIILPVVLRNVRVDRRGASYGLEFAPLLDHQSRSLAALLDVIVAAR